MDTQQALLAEIVANPTDDLSWLALADWFDDQRADFQAELVRLSVWVRHHPTGPERLRPEQRIRQLHGLGLVLPLPRQRLAVGTNSEMDLAFVPPGRFLMGSPTTELRRDEDEGPLHIVSITRGFWIGVNLVTQGHWKSLLGNRSPGRFGGRLLPVEGVTWLECQEFLASLSRQHGRVFRLPTEAEWEYACRALTTTTFSCGASLSSHQANFDGNSPYGSAPVGPWLEEPTRISSYPPNGFGLTDMHGNVWEWCSDWYDENYYTTSPEADPQGPSTGTLRVLRGGSWYSYSWSCRSANREPFAPESGSGNYGFRVALSG